MDTLEKLRFPIGKYEWSTEPPSEDKKIKLLATLKEIPTLLRKETKDLTFEQLQTPYREDGWTIAQVVHHLADSHTHAYLRCKHALLENTPSIKDYAEVDWANIEDAREIDLSSSLLILEGIHNRWITFFSSLTGEQFKREYLHPERSKKYPIYVVMELYTWHSLHHLEHIRVLKNKKGW